MTSRISERLKDISTPVKFEPRFRTFEEGEEIRIRFLNKPTFTQKKGWIPPECPICRDFPELSVKARPIPVFTPEQNPECEVPAYMMTVKETSPLYHAKYLVLRGIES